MAISLHQQKNSLKENNKMKHLFFYIAAFLGMLSLGSCSNNSDITNDTATTGVDVTLNFEDYNTTNTTRSFINNVQKEVVDLGDGLTAEVSISNDNKEVKPATRATLQGGTYYLYILDNAGALLHKYTGTLAGNKITWTSPKSKISLTNGTYTFVCTNDVVTNANNALQVLARTNNPLIGVTTKTISDADAKVTLSMKHQSARVRYNIVSYTNEGTGITADIVADASQPQTNGFSINGTANTAQDINASTTASVTIPTSGTVTYSPYIKAYNNVSTYEYFLPGTTGSGLKFNFTAGTIYGKSLAGKSITLSGLGSLVRNGSYTVDIVLNTKGMYLFDNGTVGTLADKGTRIPIGLVIEEKTTTKQGLAVALHYAQNATPIPWGGDEDVSSTQTFEWDDALNDFDGYGWTWDGSKTVGGYIKANEQTMFPAFYAAGHYDDELTAKGINVTGSNVSKWFLPSVGEYVSFCKKYLNHTPTFYGDIGIPNDVLTKISKIFTDAGGDNLSNRFPSCILSTQKSTYAGYGKTYYAYPTLQSIHQAHAITPNVHVLPFVHF